MDHTIHAAIDFPHNTHYQQIYFKVSHLSLRADFVWTKLTDKVKMIPELICS